MFHRPLHPPRSQIRRREEVICCGRLMRCDASPPVSYPSACITCVRSYLRLCSLVFARTFACVRLCSPISARSLIRPPPPSRSRPFLSLSPVICSCLSVPSSVSSPCLFSSPCSSRPPSAHHPFPSRPHTIRTFAPLGGSFGRNPRLGGRNGRIQSGFRPNG